MATISLKKAELELLWNEVGMLVENADIREQEGDTSMAEIDLTIRAVYGKLHAARSPKSKEIDREINRQRFTDTFFGRNRSKWDRFRD